MKPLKNSFLYYTNDPIRSVRLVSDPAGKVVWSAAYAPFGRMEKVWAREYNSPLKYSGKERDELLGLDYFGARYYAYGLYRFNSIDPTLDVSAAIENPQLWNKYSYCSNNPISWYDPDGRERKPGKTPPGERNWPKPPENLVGKDPRWNSEGYYEGKGGKRLSWDDRSHGSGVDRGKGKQGGHWDDEKTGGRWDISGNPLPGTSNSKILDIPMECLPAHQPISPTVQKAAAAVTIGVILYWTISEGLRVIFPPRNLIPIP